ncbi:unnamed protein product, partial [Phaeothamnion confervicola]
VSLLLEVIIGLGLFSITILFALGMFPSANRSLVQSQDLVQATDIAREVLESQIAQSYSSLPNVSTVPYLTDTVTAASSSYGTSNVKSFTYEVDINVPSLPASPYSLKNISVCVSWQYG